MKILRVFPRKTNATPDDSDVRFGLPTFFDDADEVHISVTFSWDKRKVENMLAPSWQTVAPVKVGGPAYDDPGGEFVPGMYLRNGYVITSRGCPNHCWFCDVPRREGAIRELEIKDGWNLLDSNLLACSRLHIEAVFQMLDRQQHRVRLTGGLEASRLEDWHCAWLSKIRPETAWFAYDTPSDWGPLVCAADLLKKFELLNLRHTYRCYVLVGWMEDTIEKAEQRLWAVARLGLMPMAMLYDHGEQRMKNGDKTQWIKFSRNWANPWVVGTKMNLLLKGEI